MGEVVSKPQPPLGGAQRSQRERPPTANYSLRITAPPMAWASLKIIPGDRPWNPGLELHETAGITDGLDQ